MTKTLTAYIHHKKAEQELFSARQTLIHLVELYDSGRWRRLYKEEVFASTIRKARQVVDHWTDVLDRCERGE